MKISSMTIDNFKSVRHLAIEDIENAFILVGKTVPEKQLYWMPYGQLRVCMKLSGNILMRPEKTLKSELR